MDDVKTLAGMYIHTSMCTHTHTYTHTEKHTHPSKLEFANRNMFLIVKERLKRCHIFSVSSVTSLNLTEMIPEIGILGMRLYWKIIWNTPKTVF